MNPWVTDGRDAAERWASLRTAHKIVSDRLWVGMVAAEFDDEELRLIAEYRDGFYVNSHDRICMAQIGRPFPSRRSTT